MGESPTMNVEETCGNHPGTCRNKAKAPYNIINGRRILIMVERGS
jgi:hypothetical protein